MYASSSDAYDKLEFNYVIIAQNWSCIGDEEDYKDTTSALPSSSCKYIYSLLWLLPKLAHN